VSRINCKYPSSLHAHGQFIRPGASNYSQMVAAHLETRDALNGIRVKICRRRLRGIVCATLISNSSEARVALPAPEKKGGECKGRCCGIPGRENLPAAAGRRELCSPDFFLFSVFTRVKAPPSQKKMKKVPASTTRRLHGTWCCAYREHRCKKWDPRTRYSAAISGHSEALADLEIPTDSGQLPYVHATRPNHTAKSVLSLHVALDPGQQCRSVWQNHRRRLR
jgi:hypothetical protein